MFFRHPMPNTLLTWGLIWRRVVWVQCVIPLSACTVVLSRILLWGPTLQWRHNECDGVSNHRRLDYLLNRLFKRRSKKTSNLRVTGLCEGNPPVTGEFPAQKASNAEYVSISWRHHADSNVSWANVCPTSGRQNLCWVSLGPNNIAIWGDMTMFFVNSSLVSDHSALIIETHPCLIVDACLVAPEPVCCFGLLAERVVSINSVNENHEYNKDFVANYVCAALAQQWHHSRVAPSQIIGELTFYSTTCSLELQRSPFPGTIGDRWICKGPVMRKIFLCRGVIMIFGTNNYAYQPIFKPLDWTHGFIFNEENRISFNEISKDISRHFVTNALQLVS